MNYIAKLKLYHRVHVREYWIVDAQSSQIHVYSMEPDSFTTGTYAFTDTIKAGIFEDLYIDFSSLDFGS
ncbi:MAG: Uma2 family endonuclease [Lachnospiraceae bacterium]|nr:Uma2 family endonuclease [Lachnospiraceae bacterium]